MCVRMRSGSNDVRASHNNDRTRMKGSLKSPSCTTCQWFQGLTPLSPSSHTYGEDRGPMCSAAITAQKSAEKVAILHV